MRNRQRSSPLAQAFLHAAVDEDGIERDEEAADEAREAADGEAREVLMLALEDADLGKGINGEAKGDSHAREKHTS
jgi:hypothetical protein